MTVQPIRINRRSNFSDTMTMGLAGAGIGAAVGYFSEPSIDTFVKAAATLNPQDVKVSKKAIKGFVDEVTSANSKKLSKPSIDVLVKIYDATMKRAKEINIVKAGLYGFAAGVGLFAMGLLIKPKKRYIIIKEDKKS